MTGNPVEFAPLEKPAHRGRVGLFPLEVSESTIRDVIDSVLDDPPRGEWGSWVSSISKRALHAQHRTDAAEEPDFDDPARLAVFTALAGVRFERADPFAAYPYDQDASNQLKTPLVTTPGLSAPVQRLREYYANSVLGYARDHVLRADAATLLYVLHAPRFSREASDPPIAYVDRPLYRIYDARRNNVSVTAAGIMIPGEFLTECVRVQNAPQRGLPSIRARENGYLIPDEVFETKLRTYAEFGFDRLLHIVSQYINPHDFDALKRRTPDLDDRLRKKTEIGQTIALYDPYYTVSGDHPTISQWPLPDPRLVGIVDTIRATPTLAFNEFHTPPEIATAAREYVPPPHRPPLPKLSTRRVREVLRTAAEYAGRTTGQYSLVRDPSPRDVVRRHPDNARAEWAVRAPAYSPLYPQHSENESPPWLAYKRLLTTQADISLAGEDALTPFLEGPRPYDAPAMRDARAAAHATHSATARTSRLNAVSPEVIPQSNSTTASLNWDELTFLTRVCYGMRDLIRDHPLHDGMAAYDDGLDVEIDHLLNDGYLEEHSEPRVTLYTVPADVAAALGIPRISHEGYSDSYTEKALHKYGVRLLQEHLRTLPDVEHTDIYSDLWRLPHTDPELNEAIASLTQIERSDNFNHATIRDARADVIGYSADGTLTHVGEIQTKSNNANAPTRNWDTLAALGQLGATTHWAFPSATHATDSLRKLIQADRIDANQTQLTKPRSPKECHKFVKNYDPENLGINKIHSYYSL